MRTCAQGSLSVVFVFVYVFVFVFVFVIIIIISKVNEDSCTGCTLCYSVCPVIECIQVLANMMMNMIFEFFLTPM